MRFSRCALTGIDLQGLTAGNGLHALHGGCDSVSLSERTLATPIDSAVAGRQAADSNNFLRFQGKIDLPRMLPYFGVDVVEFPHVHVEFNLLASDGRRTSLAVDSLAVRLDSVLIDSRVPVAKRRPLFSRDISVRLDRFEGSTKEAAHLSLQHLRANLENGTCQLDSLIYEPSPGRRADSLGFAALRAQHLGFTGVDWRRFLLTGDVAVGRFNVDTMLVRLVAPTHLKARVLQAVTQARHLEATLRAVGRSVRLDSLALNAVTVVEAPALRSDSIVTTIRRLSLGHAAFGPGDASWSSPFPIGRVTIALDGVLRRTKPMNMSVAHLTLDAAGQRVVADSLRAAPEGDDSAFQRRNPYRKSRVSIAMARVEARGIDLPAYLRRGALRARILDVKGSADRCHEGQVQAGRPGPEHHPAHAARRDANGRRGDPDRYRDRRRTRDLPRARLDSSDARHAHVRSAADSRLQLQHRPCAHEQRDAVPVDR